MQIIKANIYSYLTVIFLFFSAAKAENVYFHDLSGVNYLPPQATVKSLGISWVRENLAWKDIESKKGDYDWKNFDKKVMAAKEQGVNILPILAYTPVWNREINNKIGSPPKDYRAWERFVEQASQRYSAPPFNIKYFQIWNEPTKKSNFWLGSNEDFIRKIYIPAAKIIRSNGGKVVFGGWPASNPISEFDKVINISNAIDYTDVIDFHYGNVGPYEHLYKKYVLTKKVEGIWQTELGFRSTPDSVLRIYSYILYWVSNHQWNSPNKYKIFWYPGWSSYEKQPRGFTTTSPNRKVLITDNGNQLILLNKIFGGGNITKSELSSTIDHNTDRENLSFAINVGNNKKVITTLYKDNYKNSGFSYKIPIAHKVSSVKTVSSKGKAKNINYSINNGLLNINILARDVPVVCDGCDNGIFFIVIE